MSPGVSQYEMAQGGRGDGNHGNQPDIKPSATRKSVRVEVTSSKQMVAVKVNNRNVSWPCE